MFYDGSWRTIMTGMVTMMANSGCNSIIMVNGKWVEIDWEPLMADNGQPQWISKSCCSRLPWPGGKLPLSSIGESWRNDGCLVFQISLPEGPQTSERTWQIISRSSKGQWRLSVHPCSCVWAMILVMMFLCCLGMVIQLVYRSHSRPYTPLQLVGSVPPRIRCPISGSNRKGSKKSWINY